MKNTYNIRVISDICGVLPQTIRMWESRYSIFEPERSEKGQRLYSDDDVDKARAISVLTKHGHAISKLANRSTSELVDLARSVSNSSDYFNSNDSKRLFQYLSEYDVGSISSELEFLRVSCGIKKFVFDVILPLMRQIGNYVEKNHYSVTQEHIISTLVRDQLMKVHVPEAILNKRRMALATPEGNNHELSILIANIICHANRHKTSYLGPAHPASALAEALNALECEILVLGAISSENWDYEKNIDNFLVDLDRNLAGPMEVIIGAPSVDHSSFAKIKNLRFIKTLEDFDKWLVV